MATSTETQRIIDHLELLKHVNEKVTIQDLRQDFTDLVPTVSADLEYKNTLFYAA